MGVTLISQRCQKTCLALSYPSRESKQTSQRFLGEIRRAKWSRGACSWLGRTQALHPLIRPLHRARGSPSRVILPGPTAPIRNSTQEHGHSRQVDTSTAIRTLSAPQVPQLGTVIELDISAYPQALIQISNLLESLPAARPVAPPSYHG